MLNRLFNMFFYRRENAGNYNHNHWKARDEKRNKNKGIMSRLKASFLAVRNI